MSKSNPHLDTEPVHPSGIRIFNSSYAQAVSANIALDQSASGNVVQQKQSKYLVPNMQQQTIQSSKHPGEDVILASDLGKEFKTAVLSAVYSEMNSISKRSASIVVSGISKRSNISDKELFMKFCSQFFSFQPNIRSTRRLGSGDNNRTQPLLVTFDNDADSDYLMKNAKFLRTVDDAYVRDKIFINRHLTPAEGKAAFEARQLCRNSVHASSSLCANPSYPRVTETFTPKADIIPALVPVRSLSPKNSTNNSLASTKSQIYDIRISRCYELGYLDDVWRISQQWSRHFVRKTHVTDRRHISTLCLTPKRPKYQE